MSLTKGASLAQLATRELIRRNEKRYESDSTRNRPPVRTVDPEDHGKRRGDTVTIYNRSGMRPFSFAWKEAPHKSTRLKSHIASYHGKIDRLRVAVGLSPMEKKRMTAVWQCEISRLECELSRAWDAAREHTVIIES